MGARRDSCPTAFANGGRFRARYRIDAQMPPGEERRPLIADGESADGIHWERPALGRIPFAGSTADNLSVSRGNNLSVFRDDGDGVPDDERCKGSCATATCSPSPPPTGCGVRWVRRSTWPDFRTWSPWVDVGREPEEHLYTNACIPTRRPRGPT